MAELGSILKNYRNKHYHRLKFIFLLKTREEPPKTGVPFLLRAFGGKLSTRLGAPRSFSMLTRELSQPATFNFDPVYILLLSRVYRMYRCFQTLLKMGESG